MVRTISSLRQMRYSLYVIASALCSAGALILGEIILQRFRTAPLLIAVIGNALGGVILLVAAGRNRTLVWAGWRWRDWVALFVAALSIYGLSHILGYDAVRQIGSGKTALLAQLEAVFILALSILFLGERLSPRRWIAGFLALSGAALIAFNPRALQLSLGWGEAEAILGPFSVALGVVLMKPLLDKTDALWMTGIMMFVGPALVAMAIPFVLSASGLGWLPLLIILVVGALRGASWLTYNIALKHMGPARTTILFLSYPLFSVAAQLVLARLAPAIGLLVSDNLHIVFVGGALIGGGIVLITTETTPKPT